ncbi:dolichol-P-glucose transferase [Halobacteriales archaeon QS_1_68_20]|nr:MAG: dolichol-P-glucose transferase [Halobacteriales archaeon QS_1_68_20]
MGSVGIVVPAYRPDVERLREYVEALDRRLVPETIRIEVDAPTPETVDALSAMPADVSVADERRGKGAAITAGFEALETDVLAFADADGSTPAASIAAVLAPVADDEADLAVGSRRHPESNVDAHQTYARRWLGDGFARLGRRLLPVDLHDYQCGAKAIRRESWQEVRGHLYEPGFAWDVELIAIAGALDQRVTEVPVTWQDQPGSTVSTVGTSLELLQALVAVRHRSKSLADHTLHSFVDTGREGSTSLVDRLATEGRDD